MSEYVLELKGITKIFPGVKALNNVQFQLKPGEVHALMGENGAGKSTFVERFPELSLFYRLFSPLYSEMICIFPYLCPYAESAREIREIFS